MPPDTTTYYGCFSYAYWAEVKTVRIHFTDRDQSGMGALSSARRAARHAELQALVAAVVRQHPEAEHVRGGSWLYNLAAYRRLFPPAYLASAHVAPTHEEFPYLALWGQFLDRHGRVRAEPARRFLDCITHSQDRTALEACFPYQVLRPHCPLPVFQRFYDSTLSTP